MLILMKIAKKQKKKQFFILPLNLLTMLIIEYMISPTL